MSVLSFQINFPGQAVTPRLGHLYSNDDLSTVTSAGYLDSYVQSQGFSLLPTDFVLVMASDGGALCIVSETAGSFQLISITNLIS